MPPKKPTDPAARAIGAPLRILIVEDHPLIALALRVTLESFGHRVVAIVADGASARRPRREPIDLAVIDVNLSDGPTGPAVAAELARRGIAVVFHTSDPGAARAFPDALAVLEKPSTPAALFHALQHVRAQVAGD